MNAKRFSTLEYAKIEIYGHSATMTAQMKNLSSTGAFFEISNAPFLPKKGDLLNVRVRLNSIATERVVNAKVVWTKGLGLGVCFVSRNEVMDSMFARPSKSAF